MFPRKAGKPKNGDSDAATIKEALQTKTAAVFPVVQTATETEPRIITEEQKSFNAYTTLRLARSNAKYVGIREKRAKQKDEDAADKKK